MRRRALAGLVAVASLAVPASAGAVGEPLNTAPPTVSQSGSTLTAAPGRWVGVTRPFAYQWLRCAGSQPSSCEAIPGQTQITYAITTFDAASQLRVRVTGSNPVSSADAVSAPVVIPALPSTPTTPTRVLPLSPFPVITVTGRVRGARTRITGLVARGQPGALVTYRCASRRCRPGTTRTRIPRSKTVRLRRAQRLYRAGQAIDIRITAPGRVGKFTRIRARRSKAPARLDRCLDPGSISPIRCR